jgi:hypothetical protein
LESDANRCLPKLPLGHEQSGADPAFDLIAVPPPLHVPANRFHDGGGRFDHVGAAQGTRTPPASDCTPQSSPSRNKKRDNFLRCAIPRGQFQSLRPQLSHPRGTSPQSSRKQIWRDPRGRSCPAICKAAPARPPARAGDRESEDLQSRTESRQASERSCSLNSPLPRLPCTREARVFSRPPPGSAKAEKAMAPEVERADRRLEPSLRQLAYQSAGGAQLGTMWGGE